MAAFSAAWSSYPSMWDRPGRFAFSSGTSSWWPIRPLLTPMLIVLHPEPDLERQEDDRHSGQEDATDRDEIERSIVSHTVPNRSARGKSCGHHLDDMVLPIAEIER